KRRDVRADLPARITVRHQTLVAASGKVNDLERRILEQRQGFNNRPIYSTRALTSAHHEHSRQIRVQSQFLSRCLSIHTFQLGSNRRSSDLGPYFGKELRGLFKS